MGRRYYRRYYRRSPPLLAILIIAYIKLWIWIATLCFRFITYVFYLIYDFVMDKLYERKIKQINSVSVTEEIKPLPEITFEEEEEEKEVYLPYKKKSFLLTKAEYNFDKILRKVVQDNYYIGRQVPLSSIVEVTSSYKPYRSKIDKKTLDFVLFNKAGYTPHLVIELDDSSHLRIDRIERDRFVESVLRKAGIKLVRIKNSYEYHIEQISKLIYETQE